MACTSPENRSSGHSAVPSEEDLIQPIECAHVEGGPSQAFTMPGGTFGSGKAADEAEELRIEQRILKDSQAADLMGMRGSHRVRAECMWCLAGAPPNVMDASGLANHRQCTQLPIGGVGFFQWE